nr:hypothetical protein [Alcaligenaceae bacterium]
ANFLQPRLVLSLHQFLDQLDIDRLTFEQHGYALMDVSGELFERENEFSLSHIEMTEDVVNALPKLSLPDLVAWVDDLETYFEHYFQK